MVRLLDGIAMAGISSKDKSSSDLPSLTELLASAGRGDVRFKARPLTLTVVGDAVVEFSFTLDSVTIESWSISHDGGNQSRGNAAQN